MGCRKLDITDYFRLTPSTGNLKTRIPDSPGTSKKLPRGFKPVVSVSIPNYRYYSPQVGKWLSRDPLIELGLNILTVDYELENWLILEIGLLRSNLINSLNVLRNKTYVSKAFFYRIKQDIDNLSYLVNLTSKSYIYGNVFSNEEMINVYSFLLNDAINNTDFLGLVNDPDPGGLGYSPGIAAASWGDTGEERCCCEEDGYDFSSGITGDVSVIGGGGGQLGFNEQGFSDGTEDLYYYEGLGAGLNVGGSITGNFAIGRGGRNTWVGNFDNITLNIPPIFTIGGFSSDNWMGIQFGFSLGWPGVSYSRTNYVEMEGMETLKKGCIKGINSNE